LRGKFEQKTAKPARKHLQSASYEPSLFRRTTGGELLQTITKVKPQSLPKTSTFWKRSKKTYCIGRIADY
jgi:hypothetical protein